METMQTGKLEWGTGRGSPSRESGVSGPASVRGRLAIFYVVVPDVNRFESLSTDPERSAVMLADDTRYVIEFPGVGYVFVDYEDPGSEIFARNLEELAVAIIDSEIKLNKKYIENLKNDILLEEYKRRRIEEAMAEIHQLEELKRMIREGPALCVLDPVR